MAPLSYPDSPLYPEMGPLCRDTPPLSRHPLSIETPPYIETPFISILTFLSSRSLQRNEYINHQYK
jgi:hypothetical protein